ncbi:hypothetical protein LFE_1601 [Leptospirillum ferrooxidans C2-3]|jgi:hypothetical protein|uniref:Uncharacterized protein n=1 Tax=Leptospirillum ferrooxidans (strain C2-3) TaxID=1162668 RepID=I0IPT4_LEPFC|nr:hypothetical protein LFE_1601 [Leptospirillum ferrooxidans C2-3]
MQNEILIRLEAGPERQYILDPFYAEGLNPTISESTRWKRPENRFFPSQGGTTKSTASVPSSL